MEGKTNKQGIRFKDNQLVWGKLKINLIINWLNPVIKHGLDSPVKYVRISSEQFDLKLGNISQISQEGLQANVNS
ncbi:MAG: hypothetical protein QNJ41_08855 [Xenococcaceae cyanobacterium MO_188.B32]|nr:hypothetical protein [Xenococcaceae cyanobacterium MO_188.B32]